jgi:hypothetical protein
MPTSLLKRAAQTFGVATAFAGSILSTSLPAASQSRIEAGVLNCRVAGGTGFVFGSSKSLSCNFESGGRIESYTGVINKFGIDVGTTANAIMTWAVLAPTRDLAPGALSGTYGGVSGEATVGVGVGANALLGGSNRTIVLQPISVQAQKGLNLAVGIAALELRPY